MNHKMSGLLHCFFHMMGFNECESTKVQMTLDAFGGG